MHARQMRSTAATVAYRATAPAFVTSATRAASTPSTAPRRSPGVDIADFAAAALAVVFLIGIASKRSSQPAWREFVDSLGPVGLNTPRLRNAAGFGVITAETVSVCVLVMWWLPALARFGPALVTLAGLTAGLVLAVHRSKGYRCRCFGAALTARVSTHVGGNIALIIITAAGLLTPRHSQPSPGIVVFSVGVGVIVGIAAVTAGSVVELFAKGSAA